MAILSDMVKNVQGKNFKNLLGLWLPPVIWAALIFYLSSRPGLALGEGAVDFWTRKPAHIIEYAVLFLLTFRALKGSAGRIWQIWSLYGTAGALTFLYAVTDEVHQTFVPTRSGKATDLGFDFLGILLGLFLVRFYSSKSRKFG